MRKHQLLFFADCESLVKKLDGLKNNPKKWSTTKAAEDIASNFFFVYDGFNKGIKNKHSVYRGKYYIKKFCECLEEDTLKIINFKSKQKNIKKKNRIISGR